MPETQFVEVASSIPGRARLKLSRGYRTSEEMKRVAVALDARSEISNVRMNLHTGSILVHYDQERGSLDSIRSTLQGLNITLGAHPNVQLPSPGAERRGAATNLVGALGGLNRRVELATNGSADLRLLIPLGLAALSIRQMIREGMEIDKIPWYVLAWDAFQTFNTLYNSAAQPQTPAVHPATAPSDSSVGV